MYKFSLALAKAKDASLCSYILNPFKYIVLNTHLFYIVKKLQLSKLLNSQIVEQEFNTEEKYLAKFRTKILINSIFICCKRLNMQKDKNCQLSP